MHPFIWDSQLELQHFRKAIEDNESTPNLRQLSSWFKGRGLFWRINHRKMEVLMGKPQENHRKMEVYPLVNLNSYRKSPSLIGKSTINGPYSIAMLNYQRVTYTKILMRSHEDLKKVAGFSDWWFQLEITQQKSWDIFLEKLQNSAVWGGFP